jgi:hypothetical protein
VSNVDLSVIQGNPVQIIVSPPYQQRSAGASLLSELNDVDLETVEPVNKQPLTYDSSSLKWIPYGNVVYSGSVEYTTSLLDPQESEDFSINCGNVFQLLSLNASTPAWVRVYGKSSARSADLRISPGGTPPPAGAEFYAELVTVSPLESIRLSPVPTVQSWYGDAFIRVVNTDSSPRAITLKFYYLAFEPSADHVDVSFLLQPSAEVDTDVDPLLGIFGYATGPAYGYQNFLWPVFNPFAENSSECGVEIVDDAYSPIILSENPAPGATNRSLIYHVAGVGEFDASESVQTGSLAPFSGVIPEYTFEYIFRYGSNSGDDYDNHGVTVLLSFSDSTGNERLALAFDRELTASALRFFVVVEGQQEGDEVVIPGDFEDFTHVAAVFLENEISVYAAGQSIGSVGPVSAPVGENLILFLADMNDDNSTAVRTGIKGIRFTPKAIYSSAFTPPTDISTLLPEYM